MTTIATDGKTMAADTKVSGDGLYHCDIEKLIRAKNGDILGWCGSAFDRDGFEAWYNSGMSGKPDVGEGFEGLVLRKNGTVLCVNDKGYSFDHTLPAAAGSGAQVAYGAMDCGASPSEAVFAAIKRDAGSGGRVVSMAIQEPLHAAA